MLLKLKLLNNFKKYILKLMIFNLNIVDLTITIKINHTLYKKNFIVPLNYLQFHYIQNSFDKNYSFYNFLSMQ